MLPARFPADRMAIAHYTTLDPYLASFLCFRGAELAGLKRLGPKKVEFRFVACREFHSLLRLYWSGQLTPLIPAQLFGTLRCLKSLSITRR